jgi:hypothetical protein
VSLSVLCGEQERKTVIRLPHVNTRLRSRASRPRQSVFMQDVQGLQTVLMRADDEEVDAVGCTQKQQIRGLRARPHRYHCFRKG